MSDLQPIILLMASRLEKLSTDFLWGPQEAVCFGAEVTKMHLNGGTDSRILLISLGAIYVFRTRSLTKNELASKYNLVDVEKVSYIEPNIVTFLIKDTSGQATPLTLQTDNALDIAKFILFLNKICVYGLDSYNVKIESTPPTALVPVRLTARPKNALFTRIIQIAHKFDQKFPLDQLKVIQDWDAHPQAILRLSSTFICGPASYSIAMAIGMDPDMKTMVLDGFAPAHLQNFLQLILAKSKSMMRLSLENYTEATSENYNLPAPITTKVIELSFKNCNPALIFSILNGLTNFAGRFQYLTISQTKLSGENFRYLFDMLNRLPCFMGLTSLRFEEGASDNLVVDDLARFLPIIKVNSFAIIKTTLDNAPIISNIFPHTSSIHSLSLSCNRLADRVKPDLCLPDCLSYLDLSRCQVTPVSLFTFLKAVLTKPRANLLALNLSDLISTTPNEPLVKCFTIANCQPVIGEFIYSGNPLLPEHTKVLLNFLKTQKRLLYLNLSRCFRERIDENLALVAEFVIETKLAGLEIGCMPNAPLRASMTNFIKLLVGKAQLTTLNIERSGMGDAGLLALKQYVDADIKLTSLNCDGANPDTPNALAQSYISFTKIDRVMVPKIDMMKFNGKVSIPNNIATKLPPLTLFQRVTEYENMEAGTSSNDVSPMDALVDLMGKMTQTICGKGENIFEKEDLIPIFKQSLTTSTVHIKTTQDTRSDALLHLLNPNTAAASELSSNS